MRQTLEPIICPGVFGKPKAAHPGDSVWSAIWRVSSASYTSTWSGFIVAQADFATVCLPCVCLFLCSGIIQHSPRARTAILNACKNCLASIQIGIMVRDRIALWKLTTYSPYRKLGQLHQQPLRAPSLLPGTPSQSKSIAFFVYDDCWPNFAC